MIFIWSVEISDQITWDGGDAWDRIYDDFYASAICDFHYQLVFAFSILCIFCKDALHLYCLSFVMRIIAVHGKLFFCSIMVVCLYVSCRRKKKESATFFKVPKDESIAKLWFNRVQRYDLTFKKFRKGHVCHKHFEDNQVKIVSFGVESGLYLKKGELPLTCGKKPRSPVIFSTTFSRKRVC